MRPLQIVLSRKRTARATTQVTHKCAQYHSHRTLWLTIHLYLGLWAGAVLALAGITGSILVFWQDIDEWLNAAQLTVTTVAEGQPAYRPLEEIVAAATGALAQGVKPLSVEFPHHARGVATILAQGPAANPDDGDTLNVFVNPYTAQVTGARTFYSASNPLHHCLIGFVFKLHYSLLLWDTGITIVGIVALFLLIEVLVGVFLWWPPSGKWRSALTIKRKTSSIRLTYDLHKTAGVYSGLILLVVLLSGVYLNLPQQFLWTVQVVSPGTRGDNAMPTSVALPGSVPISPGRAVEIARERYPDGRLNWVSFPAKDTGVYLVSFRDVPGLSHFWSERQVYIEQYSGAILDVRSPDTRRSAGEAFIDWQWPLHSGQAFGMTGRILVFLTGVACPALYITGFIRWRQKRRAAKFHEARLRQLAHRGSTR